jgi:hypothetical protein
MSKSAMMKAEELARRADEKQRQINEMTRKLGMSQSPSPTKSVGGGDLARRSVADMYET